MQNLYPQTRLLPICFLLPGTVHLVPGCPHTPALGQTGLSPMLWIVSQPGCPWPHVQHIPSVGATGCSSSGWMHSCACSVLATCWWFGSLPSWTCIWGIVWIPHFDPSTGEFAWMIESSCALRSWLGSFKVHCSQRLSLTCTRRWVFIFAGWWPQFSFRKLQRPARLQISPTLNKLEIWQYCTQMWFSPQRVIHGSPCKDPFIEILRCR